MDTRDCKILFRQGTKRETAENIIRRYAPKATIDNFVEDSQIGCNVMSFAVVVLEDKEIRNVMNDPAVVRVDTLSTSKSPKNCSNEQH